MQVRGIFGYGDIVIRGSGVKENLAYKYTGSVQAALDLAAQRAAIFKKQAEDKVFPPPY